MFGASNVLPCDMNFKITPFLNIDNEVLFIRIFFKLSKPFQIETVFSFWSRAPASNVWTLLYELLLSLSTLHIQLLHLSQRLLERTKHRKLPVPPGTLPATRKRMNSVPVRTRTHFSTQDSNSVPRKTHTSCVTAAGLQPVWSSSSQGFLI